MFSSVKKRNSLCEKDIFGEISNVVSLDDVVLIHSSFIAFSELRHFDKWLIARELKELLQPNRTILIPAFTFSACKTGVFHRDLPSEVGQLADVALELREFSRSNHSIFSFAISGPRTNEIMNCNSSTSFGTGSVFHWLVENNAKIVMAGCGWDKCTLYHHFEDVNEVPYRKSKIFEIFRGDDVEAVDFFVRCEEIEAVNNFDLIDKKLHDNNLIVSSTVAGGKVQACEAQAIALVTNEILRQDKFALVENPAVVKFRCHQQAKKRENDTTNIAIIGGGNQDLVKQFLEKRLTSEIFDKEIVVKRPDYGKHIIDTLDPESWVHNSDMDYLFFTANLPDLVEEFSVDWVEAERIDAAVDAYLASIEAVSEKSNCPLVVFSFFNFTPSSLGNIGGDKNEKCPFFRSNLKLNSKFQENDQVFIFNLEYQNNLFFGGRCVDHKAWCLGRYPYTSKFSKFLAERMAACVLNLSGRSVRLIIVDLDNTLWGGVIGEDGVDGVSIGGDYPGNSFLNFQKALKGLNRRGIALAIASKNDEGTAMSAIESHPQMHLEKSDFVSHRINWRPKWENVLELCEEIELSPEHVLFIDDNPLERELMRQFLPQTKVLELPNDPAGYLGALENCIWLECLTLTKEDISRSVQYSKMVQVRKERSRYSDLDLFYKSLNSRVSLERLNPANRKRAFQLSVKTNQFNTTTRRYSLAQLEEFHQQSDLVLVIGYEDKFFAYESVGLIVIKGVTDSTGHWVIDNFLLSCRVLGRGVEIAIVKFILDLAHKQDVSKVTGIVIETERNIPAQEVFQSAGFVECKEKKNIWHAVDFEKTQTPGYVEITLNGVNDGII